MPQIPKPADLDAYRQRLEALPYDGLTAETAAALEYADLVAEALQPLARLLHSPFALARLIAETTAKAVRDTYAGEVGVAVPVDLAPIALEWKDLGDLERTVAAIVAGAITEAVTPADLADQVEAAIFEAGAVDTAAFTDAPVDVSNAVLLDDVETIVGLLPGGPALAITLAGRVNHRADRAQVTYLVNGDGAAGLIANIAGSGARTSPLFGATLLEAIRLELEQS